MRRFHRASLLAITLTLATLPTAQAQQAPFETGSAHWRGADGTFASWELHGVVLGADGGLRLDQATGVLEQDPYPPDGYKGRNFYNGGSFVVGTATSQVVPVGSDVAEAIASWNAQTPPGTWVEALLRARVGDHFTTWYSMGVWAAGSETVERHSVAGQRDSDGAVAVDTLLLSGQNGPASSLQLRLRLFSATPEALPTISAATMAFSSTPQPPAALVPGDPARWNKVLSLPECSQMVYVGGGEAWCSPTSVAMVRGYWQQTGPCEPLVRAAAEGTFDWAYNGNGNWPFNTAYAASLGLEASVVRFSSLAQAEPWIAAGVPVVFSIAWDTGELSGAPAPSSRGHLAVLVGFDASGNPVVHDPAAAGDAGVQRTYDRAELERLWLTHSGGAVYLIHPPGWPVPTLP